MKKNNPLLCDIESGLCEIPLSESDSGNLNQLNIDSKMIKVIYFTDPICSSCWGIEPQLRKLKLEYGEYFSIDYCMGGLLPSWNGFVSGGITKPADVAKHWEEASEHYEMPIDGDVWIEDPLVSSYPSAIAYKAATLQGVHAGKAFLRRIKEMVFLEKKNISQWKYLLEAATSVGLDLLRFRIDYEEKANRLFQEDLQLTRKYSVRGFPTLCFSAENKQQQTVYGFKSYTEFEKAILSLYPEAKKYNYSKTPESLFGFYPTMTTKEFAVLSEISMKEAFSTLLQLSKENKVSRLEVKNGDLWIVK
ncbi:MAG: DsbA family protein [Spirosomataceae bacterium]